MDGNASKSYPAVQLKGAVGILALLSQHRDNARLQNLFASNLWLSLVQRVRSHMMPGGLAVQPSLAASRSLAAIAGTTRFPRYFAPI